MIRREESEFCGLVNCSAQERHPIHLERFSFWTALALQWEGRRRHSPCDSLLLSIRSQDPRAELQGFVFSALSQACLLQLLEYQ